MNPIAARSSSKVSGSKSGGRKASHGIRALVSAGRARVAHVGEMRRAAKGAANVGEMETDQKVLEHGEANDGASKGRESGHAAPTWGPLAATERVIMKLRVSSMCTGLMCDILTQGLIGLIEYLYHQGIPSFLEGQLKRTLRLSMLTRSNFRMGDRLESLSGCIQVRIKICRKDYD
jgi:hypothetical protein